MSTARLLEDGDWGPWLVSGLDGGWSGPGSGDMGVSAILREGGESGPGGDIQEGRDDVDEDDSDGSEV